jgi:hypothetical protein
MIKTFSDSVLACFLVHRQLSSQCVLTWNKGQGSSLSLFYKGMILLLRTSPAWSNHLPMATLPVIITLGLGSDEFGESKHLVYSMWILWVRWFCENKQVNILTDYSNRVCLPLMSCFQWRMAAQQSQTGAQTNMEVLTQHTCPQSQDRGKQKYFQRLIPEVTHVTSH